MTIQNEKYLVLRDKCLELGIFLVPPLVISTPASTYTRTHPPVPKQMASRMPLLVMTEMPFETLTEKLKLKL